MKRNYGLKRICAAALCLLLLIGLAATAYAADSTVNFNGHYASSVFGFIPADKDLFQNFKGLMPGETVTQDVVIKNRSRDDIRVYLFGDPVSETKPGFLEQVKITVKKGNTTIVSDSAKASWPSNTTYYNLGWLDPGETLTLLVTMEIPATMGNEFQNAVGEVKWGFRVDQFDDDDGDDDDDDDDDDIPLGPPVIIINDGEQIPLAPGTGDDANIYLWGGLFVIFAVLLAVLLVHKRRRKA